MWRQIIALTIFSLGFVSCLHADDGRIVKGKNAVEGAYPFMVSICTTLGTHFCGGSIIHRSWVLTAAHCVTQFSRELFRVRSGLTKLSSASTNAMMTIDKVCAHENYSPGGNYPNDIALLKMDGMFFFVYPYVGRVLLPEKNFEASPDLVKPILIGWGLTKTRGIMPDTLQEVNLKVYTDQECHSIHHGLTNADHLCSGNPEDGKGQCSGDSGGPLVYQLGDEYCQIGIVSWSRKPCATTPGAFTKVSHFIDWINKTMNS